MIYTTLHLTGYITLNKDGIISEANITAASLLDLERDDLIKGAFILYIHPDCRNKFHHHIEKVLKNRNRDNIELILLKGGNPFYVHLETIIVFEGNGDFKEFRINLTDISDHKKAEYDLREKNAEINSMLKKEISDHKRTELKLEELVLRLKNSNKELEQFAYVSSHDLKEPLRMISTFLQLLKSRYGEDLDIEANEFIDYAVDGAKRMEIMINDLLEYSRVTSQERKFEYLQSDKILETVLINIKSLIDDNNVVITHDPLPLIYANHHQMVQLFQNLIVNAIKYGRKDNPKIHISAENVDDEYLFSVRDNGIGIDPKFLDKIFTIFQRLHTREEYEGTGIGLAISKKIVQKHRGKIWAESEPGEGSIFYFTIPNRNY